MSQDFNEERFRELVLYFAEQSEDDPMFGATKLNKLVGYSDFYAYAHLGHSLTGATYQVLKNGPAPVELLPVRGRMISEGDAELEDRERYGYVQKRLKARRAPNMDIFSSEERTQIDEILELLRHENASSVSHRSHKDFLGWRLGEEGETIPYESIFISRRRPADHLIERGRELAEEAGWV
jgi:hypothetical protein